MNSGHVVLGVSVVLFAAGTLGAHVPDEVVASIPPAPCKNYTIMQSEMQDDGMLAMCDGMSEYQFYGYDMEDGAWEGRVIVRLRGGLFVPVAPENANALVRHAELIGDHRAVGMWD